MDEWSTQSKSPQKMWEILKKSNPELDEQFFRLPDGRWDTSRLSQGMATINREKEIERKKKDSELRLLEAVCVQHEIDHLNGLTIHDREIKLEPTKVETKIGRNDPCPCGSGKKHKKCCL